MAQRSDGELTSLSAASKTRSACRPEIPGGFTAVNTAKGITLTWDTVDYATGYSVSRSTNGTKWTTVKTLSGSDTLTWTDTKGSSGTGYYYRIQALVKLNGTTFRSGYGEAPLIYRLSRPSLGSVTAVEDGFRLSWKRITGAGGYRIYRSCDGRTPELLTTIEGGRTLSFTDHSAGETGKYYSYSLEAWKDGEERLHLSALSTEKTAIHPRTPEGFSVTNSAKGIALSWEKVEHATGYVIYRSTNGTKWTSVKTLSGADSLSWTDTNRSSGSRYYYRIRTLAKVSGTTYRSDFVEAPVIYRLSRPSVNTITLVEDGFQLSWKRITGADGYRIYRSCDGCSPELLTTIESGRTLSFTDHTATEPGKFYTYSLVAWKEAGEQLYLSESALEKSAIRPEVPGGFTVVRNGKRNTLTWEQVDHATGYEISRSSNGTKWTSVKTLSGADSLSWTDSSKYAGSKTHYRVRAVVKVSGFTYRSGYCESQQP